MTEFQRPAFVRSQNILRTLAILAIVLSAIAIGISILRPVGRTTGGQAVTDTSLSDIVSRGVIRVGYGSYPPYTGTDLTSSGAGLHTPEGFSVDLIKAIAARMSPPVKVEFHPFSWDSLGPEVDRGNFDVIVDPVFQTIPRAENFSLLVPYSYFGIAAAVVRKSDNRFKTFNDLDRSDITIALPQGWTTAEYAQAHLTKPKFDIIPVTGNAFNQLDEVAAGRADVALNDVPTVAQYVAAHRNTVKALWLNDPPATVPGGFLVGKNATALARFLDTDLRVLQTDGTIAKLDRKWQTYGYFPKVQLTPGAGLSPLLSTNN